MSSADGFTVSIRIQAEPIVLDAPACEAPERDDCGAEVRFIGKVRNDARRSANTHLVLEHFPGVTEAEIARIVEQARERWSLQKVRVVHRVGPITVGATIVLVETASAHRRDAYEANVFIMDYLKTEAPFWKQEAFADGTAVWVEAKSSDQKAAERWQGSRPADAATAKPGCRIGALILSGGEGSRMGYCNKGLQTLLGKPMVQHVIDALRPHVDYLAISANHDLADYQALGLPVFSDNPEVPVRGPLAGVIAAAPHFPGDLDAVLVVPCDTPLLPPGLVPRMAQALFAPDAPTTPPSSRPAVVLARTVSEGRDDHHGIFMCRSSVLVSLLAYLTRREDHSLMGWLRGHPSGAVYFDDPAAFRNVNDLETLQRLESL